MESSPECDDVIQLVLPMGSIRQQIALGSCNGWGIFSNSNSRADLCLPGKIKDAKIVVCCDGLFQFGKIHPSSP